MDIVKLVEEVYTMKKKILKMAGIALLVFIAGFLFWGCISLSMDGGEARDANAVSSNSFGVFDDEDEFEGGGGD